MTFEEYMRKNFPQARLDDGQFDCGSELTVNPMWLRGFWKAAQMEMIPPLVMTYPGTYPKMTPTQLADAIENGTIGEHAVELVAEDEMLGSPAVDAASADSGDSILDPNIKPLFPKGIFLEGKKVGEVVPVTADGLPSNSYVFRISREDAIAAEERGDYNGDLVCIPYPSGTTHVQTEQRTGEWGTPHPVLYPEGRGYWLLLSDAAFARIAGPFEPDNKVTHVDLGGEN